MFGNIRFVEDGHRYFIGEQELQSVTSVRQLFQPPPDQQKAAAGYAEQNGLTVDQVLQNWEQAKVQSQALGLQVHKLIANSINGFAQLGPFPAEFEMFRSFWGGFSKKVRPERVEWVIADEGLGIAGTVDLFFFSDKVYHVADWKTGNLKFRNGFRKLLPPFEAYDDCHFNTYSIQLSLYRLILERAGYPMGDGYLIHLTPDSVDACKVRDFRGILNEFFSKHRVTSPAGFVRV